MENSSSVIAVLLVRPFLISATGSGDNAQTRHETWMHTTRAHSHEWQISESYLGRSFQAPPGRDSGQSHSWQRYGIGSWLLRWSCGRWSLLKQWFLQDCTSAMSGCQPFSSPQCSPWWAPGGRCQEETTEWWWMSQSCSAPQHRLGDREDASLQLEQ